MLYKVIKEFTSICGDHFNYCDILEEFRKHGDYTEFVYEDFSKVGSYYLSNSEISKYLNPYSKPDDEGYDDEEYFYL